MKSRRVRPAHTTQRKQEDGKGDGRSRGAQTPSVRRCSTRSMSLSGQPGKSLGCFFTLPSKMCHFRNESLGAHYWEGLHTDRGEAGMGVEGRPGI